MTLTFDLLILNVCFRWGVTLRDSIPNLSKISGWVIDHLVKFCTFLPLLKLGEGWAEHLTWRFKISLGHNLWYAFGARPLRGRGDSTHFPCRFFWEHFMSHQFSELGERLISQVWWGQRAMMSLPTWFSDFKFDPSFWNYSASKANIRRNFEIFELPVKIRRGGRNVLVRTKFDHRRSSSKY